MLTLRQLTKLPSESEDQEGLWFFCLGVWQVSSYGGSTSCFFFTRRDGNYGTNFRSEGEGNGGGGGGIAFFFCPTKG